MLKLRWILLSIAIFIVVLGVIVYFLLFINYPLVISGKVILEDTAGTIDKNVGMALCIYGDDGHKYFLANNDWSLVNKSEYYKWYGKNVVVEGHIKEVSILGDKCYLIAVNDIKEK